MKLSAHFSLEELTHTEQRMDNSCPAELLPALTDTADMMERIRAVLSAAKGREIPIIVTSGYRSPAVNAAVGGQPKSDHVNALAVDFKAPAFGTPYDICKFLEPILDDLGIGQCIHEFGRWVHVSSKAPERSVNRVITITAAGVQLGVQVA